MKHLIIGRVLPVLLAVSFGCLSVMGQATNSSPLTNASIVKLVKAGFKDKTILSIIGSRPANFDLTPERMIELKRSGVSEKVILGMLSRQEGMEVFDDSSWGEDPFFAESLDPKKGDSARTQSPGNDGSTDIFGSSGGLKGQTRSRGANGSVSNDTFTTGSATVRIIKPPAEANAPMKLEKTRSLTNASIIELVEAGFSEGTIIRRIEQSPVEFDLSPSQLAELRKHRVSEKILTAMKSATGEDSDTAKSPTRSDVTPKE